MFSFNYVFFLNNFLKTYDETIIKIIIKLDLKNNLLFFHKKTLKAKLE
jgi:hypothetical protein